MNFLSDIKINNKEVGYKSDIAINKSTLGYVKKNLLKNTAKTSTKSGVTFTVNTDKSVTANGTNSTSNYANIIVFKGELEAGTYTLTGAVSDVFRIRLGVGASEDGYGSYVGVDRGNGYTFIVVEKALYTVTCQVESGKTASNIIFYPMIRYADITDSTYEPYKESVDERLIQNKSDIALNRTTLGTQCKNLLKLTLTTTTVSGITFTVNDDYSITLNGTATGTIWLQVGYTKGANFRKEKLIFTGNPSGTGSGNGLEAWYLNSTTGNKYVSIANGNILTESEYDSSGVIVYEFHIDQGRTYNNVTYYPMLRYADITDDTYEPYSDNIDTRISQSTSRIAVNKSTLGYIKKNLLKNNAVTQTVSGVTFTINDDKSITVNGTATAQISFIINNKVGLGIGNYILTGCPSGGSWNTFYLTAYASSEWLSAPDFGSGCRIENKTVTQVVISIASGYTANNLKFYPMLRDADIIDDTYEPYQPSLIDRCMLKDNTGTILYNGVAAASTANITIENLSKYSLVWTHITGASTKSFEVSCSLPISYLSKGNTVYIGGIPSSNSSDSSTDEYVKSMAGYIKASMTTDSPDVLNLEVSDGIIGSIQIISVM